MTGQVSGVREDLLHGERRFVLVARGCICAED